MRFARRPSGAWHIVVAGMPRSICSQLVVARAREFFEGERPEHGWVCSNCLTVQLREEARIAAKRGES